MIAINEEIYGIDSNVLLAVIIPESTKALIKEIESAGKIIQLMQKEKIHCITSSIIFAEIRWVLLRENKETFEIIEATLKHTLRKSLTIVDVDSQIASQAAHYRWKYYTKANAFSYNDGIYLATSLLAGAKTLISTDPHLLNVEELRSMTPAQFQRHLKLAK